MYPEVFTMKKIECAIIFAMCILISISIGTVTVPAAKSAVLLHDNRQSIDLPIVMYHGISESASGESKYFISKDRFESDLKWYRDSGYTTILPSQLYAYVSGEAILPSKPILLTFDDGYCNNYTYAFPLLQKYNMKAVISLIGSDSEIASDDIYRVPSSCNLSWGEVALMAKSGLVEFGNHTYDLHRIADGRKGANQKPGESVEAYHEMLSADLTKIRKKSPRQAAACLCFLRGLTVPTHRTKTPIRCSRMSD